MRSTGEELLDEFTDSIFDKYEPAVSKAAEVAAETAFQWGAPVNRANRQAGGYYWSSYKAVCRRFGLFSNAQGMHNWNDALGAPMMKIIAPGWERSFARRLPTVLAGFARNAINIVKAFHSEVGDRARKTGTGIAGLVMLEQQISVHDHILKDLANTVRDGVNAAQKEINRAFIPAIQEAVGPAYETCTDESGISNEAKGRSVLP